MALDDVLIGVAVAGVVAALYAYVGFPAIAALLGVASPRHRALVDRRGGARKVTVIISAYNEERSLEAKIRNVLATDYPRDRLQVLVVSDASTDRTNDIARSFDNQGVCLIVQPTRRGKSLGLNDAIACARGDVVVFTDANASFTPQTIPTLLRYFADPKVGLVTGYTQYETGGSGEVARATNLYTSLERTIKIAESRWGCCVGADGAVFAMRRRLFRPLRHDDINDFVIPLDVIAQGSECLFAVGAWCAEPASESVASEFRRQARITNRTLRALWRHVGLLNPFRYGLFSFFLFSHKIVRFLVPVLMTCSVVALGVWVGVWWPSLGVAAIIAAALVLLMQTVSTRVNASLGVVARPIRMVNIAVTMHAAALQGWWHFLCGRRDVVWQHDRSATVTMPVDTVN
jgi:cellulose synthase/poly-beta-1,6-N-acetylglucosamine synthase-like glycosyltransferase